jgi:hypothetical protein
MRTPAALGNAVAAALGCAAWLASSAMARAAPAAAPACPAEDQAGADTEQLSALAAALKPGRTLNILAVGSTAFGPQATAAADSSMPPGGTAKLGALRGVAPATPSPTGFAWQMAHVLEASFKGLHVTFTFTGGHGLPADALLDRMRTELAHHSYQLVIWQTGTVEAVNMTQPEEFYQILTDGAAVAAAAGADLVLVDPQYSRFLEANANLAPYLDAMQAAGALPGVVLFHRFDLMRDWAESGELDLERAAASDRPALAARLHACLGRALARSLIADVTAGE